MTCCMGHVERNQPKFSNPPLAKCEMSGPDENLPTTAPLPGRRSPFAHNLWLGLWIAFCALLVASAGFASFTSKSRSMKPPDSLHADAIVVLTGGSERIAAGLVLLKEKAAKRLLITGVHPATTASQLQHIFGINDQLFKCCIDLDKRAPDTRGNAIEAAQWARGFGFRKLVVVTSDYHILRSMVEFSRAMPEMELIAYPVSGSDSGAPTQSVATFRLWLNEYVKYLLALVKLQAKD